MDMRSLQGLSTILLGLACLLAVPAGLALFERAGSGEASLWPADPIGLLFAAMIAVAFALLWLRLAMLYRTLRAERRQRIDATAQLETALQERRDSEESLQTRVHELEETRQRLERQGADLVQTTADLKAARDIAEAANEAKSEFLATMSHELRTPLNAILGFSEVIRDQAFGPVGSAKYRDYACDIHESGQHLLDLINDILDLSKIESGTSALYEDLVDVPKTVESIRRLVLPRGEAAEVRIAVALQEPLPPLRADVRSLKQILVNLLTNAIKFSHPGGRVTLSATCEAERGYRFEVADDGVGMAPEDIPKAMAKFGQIDSGFNRKYEGTGLGLPLTKALVEQHDGRMEVVSRLGEGTRVIVRFPPERSLPAPAETQPPRRIANR